jgi:hypothetical protein
MSYADLEEFAKILVRDVRDASIVESDLTLRPVEKGPIAKQWREALQTGDPEHIVKTIIPDVVDCTISRLLWAIDDGALELIFKTSTGKTLNLAKDLSDELVGWYEDEWRKTLSNQRRTEY